MHERHLLDPAMCEELCGVFSVCVLAGHRDPVLGLRSKSSIVWASIQPGTYRMTIRSIDRPNGPRCHWILTASCVGHSLRECLFETGCRSCVKTFALRVGMQSEMVCVKGNVVARWVASRLRSASLVTNENLARKDKAYVATHPTQGLVLLVPGIFRTPYPESPLSSLWMLKISLYLVDKGKIFSLAPARSRTVSRVGQPNCPRLNTCRNQTTVALWKRSRRVRTRFSPVWSKEYVYIVSKAYQQDSDMVSAAPLGDSIRYPRPAVSPFCPIECGRNLRKRDHWVTGLWTFHLIGATNKTCTDSAGKHRNANSQHIQICALLHI